MLTPDKQNSLQNNLNVTTIIYNIQIEIMLILLHLTSLITYFVRHLIKSI